MRRFKSLAFKSVAFKSVAVWTFASFAVSVALIMPGSLNAVDIAPAGPAAVAQPRLVLDGAEITLSAVTAETLHAGDHAVFSLMATNTTDHSITVTPNISLDSSKLARQMSRVMPTPTQIWKQSPSITIAAHETATLRFDQTPKLEAGSLISAMVSGGGKSVMLLHFSVQS